MEAAQKSKTAKKIDRAKEIDEVVPDTSELMVFKKKYERAKAMLPLHMKDEKTK